MRRASLSEVSGVGMAEFAAAGGDSGRAGEAAVSDAVKLRKMIDMTRAITANFARINASLKK